MTNTKMKNEVLFTERQRFKQWWLWLILIAANVLTLYGVFKHVVGEQQVGNKPMSNTELLITCGLTLIPIILFITFRLDTQIRGDGIYVKFFPFHLSFRQYTWDKIAKSFIRKYNPIGEYGGWGLRFGFFGRGRAFNVSGDQGLQLEFSNHKKLLIGTTKPDELKEALNKIGQLKQ